MPCARAALGATLTHPIERAVVSEISPEVVAASSAFAKENLNVAVQYADWLRGGQVATLEEIQPGQGAVVRRGARLVAVYRDEAGVCHGLSAACPHLGGVVAWNSSERTWDCPCHGSRFDAKGRVLNGPAISDLPADDGDLAEGTVYALLIRIEQRGLVDVEKVPSAKGPPRTASSRTVPADCFSPAATRIQAGRP